MPERSRGAKTPEKMAQENKWGDDRRVLLEALMTN